MNKNRIIKILNARIAYHIYFWSCIFCFMTLNHMDMELSSLNMIMKNMIVIGLLIISVYSHFYIFEKYLSQKRYWLYIVLLILIVAVFVTLKNVIFIALRPCRINIFSNVYFIGTYLIITTALKIGKAGFEQRLMLQEIKAKHIQTELELLKSQVNPHFLFNTLNNLFGLVRKLDETVAGGIAQLSHLMRYMIYESNVEKIELEKEVMQINRLIELQKLRFLKEDDITIDFKIDGNIKKVLIPPMLLIPFVENAFKHGISLEKSSFINIHLAYDENVLQFSVRNSTYTLSEGNKEINTGLGLKNVKRRLELLFPETHDFKVQELNNEYEIKIILNL